MCCHSYQGVDFKQNNKYLELEMIKWCSPLILVCEYHFVLYSYLLLCLNVFPDDHSNV